MALTRQEVREVYRKRAKWYDVTANLYYVLGFREQAYRRKAVQLLNLQEGDTVVEIGCGTGLNFPLIQHSIGRGGKIIGVDLTSEMLDQARLRVERHGWTNVELVCSSANEYEFHAGLGGILSTFALTLEPQYDAVIKRGAEALISGTKFVVLDFKVPEHWPAWMVSLGMWITRPFGVTIDLGERHPWESIKHYLSNYQILSFYWDLAYIAAGTKA